jgi:hypothetical protein
MPVPILAAVVARYVATGLSRTKAVQKAKRSIKEYLDRNKKRNRFTKGSDRDIAARKREVKRDQEKANAAHNTSKRSLRESLGIKQKNKRLTKKQIAKNAKKAHNATVKANVKAFKNKKGQLDLFKDHK